MSTARTIYRSLRTFAGQAKRRVRYFGRERYCPVCRSHASRFVEFGMTRRPDVACPYCLSAERHRLAWLVLTQRTNYAALTSGRILHIAPEDCIAKQLRRRKSFTYVTADLFDPGVDVRMDATRCPFADGTFDGIVCCHVLQHIIDDRAAMRDLARILRPDAWMIAMVRMVQPHTVDQVDAHDSQTRPLHGFNADEGMHEYGYDVVDRLNDAGFAVELVRPKDLLTPDECNVMRIPENDTPTLLCRKK